MEEAPRSDALNQEASNSPSRWFRIGSSTPFPTRELFDALGNSPIGIAICDRSLRFVAVNRRLAEINNIPPDEHPGRRVYEIVGGLGPTVVARLERVFETGEPLYNAELTGTLGANPEFGHWLENYFPILGNSNKVMRVGVFLVSLLGVRQRSRPSRPLPGSTVPRNGEPAIPLATAGEVALSGPCHPAGPRRPQCKSLSAREIQVLHLLANGASSKQVSATLGISVKTVETYRARLMLKLHATSIAHLVHYAIHSGIVDLQVPPSGIFLQNNSDFTII
jgi:DNA-binding CsgD family transcriptional regulator